MTLQAAAIIVAAGSSARMGFDKICAPLAGRTVLEWSLQAFQDCSDVSEIVLVCAADRLTEFQKLAAAFSKVRNVTPGGAQRSASVLNGLAILSANPPALIAVHDAARPLISPSLVSRVLHAAMTNQAASAAQPVTDSLHRGQTDGVLSETVSRQNLFAMQTPQAASFDLLWSALRAHPDVTDEVSALIASGIHPQAIVHNEPNFKITYPLDLQLAEILRNADYNNSAI